ncbi:MAG: hypothetical protein JXK04_00905 [Campylobacterales bacterium]|nr:hypothetical protein [Campylobacterales bacterium]
MKKAVLFFIISLTFAFQSWGACSNTYGQVFINETNTKDNFIEIYVLDTAPTGSYTVKACISDTDCSTATYLVNGTSSWYVKNFNLISNRSEFDITLYGPDENVADYIRIGDPPTTYNTDYQNCPSILSKLNTSAHTYHRTNSGQRDFYRSPDGSSTWQESNWQDDTKGSSNTGDMPPPPECTSFAYDLYHTADPYRLQTRLSSHPFDVNVTVACTGTGTIPSRKIVNLYGFSGDCPADIAGLPMVWSGAADINDTVRTITLSGLNSPKAYSNLRLMLETDTGELHCSSDHFSLRPSTFAIVSPASPIRAGEITVQVSATESDGGYDGTAIATTALQIPDPECPVTNGFLAMGSTSEPLSLAFANDVHTSEMNATDIGEIVLNVKDTAWTTVDQAGDCILESNATIPDALGRIGCNVENNLSLKIVPHHFDVNSTLSDFAGGTFTYLSRDLAMSADMNIKITAKTSGGKTTLNYTDGCYAKPSTLTLQHSQVPDPLSRILYDLNGVEDNVTKNGDMTLSLAESVFSQGIAPLLMRLNFDRDPSRVLNPFDFTLQSAVVVDSDATSSADGLSELAGTATYLYGRVRVYDIATDAPSAPNPVEFEIYSSTPAGFVSGMPQNTLGWYRNLHHDAAAEGNVIRGGFSAGSDDPDVGTSALPSYGVQIVTVTASEDKTVHLDIAPWLWYSRTNNYDYAAGCNSHPCFLYDHTGTASGVTGVTSGIYQGSDFEMKPAKEITNKGVKLFR